MVDINFSPSVPTAGDQLNITCSATVPERLVHSPDSFIISYDIEGQQVVAEDNPDAEQFAIAREDNIYSQELLWLILWIHETKGNISVVIFLAPLSAISDDSQELLVDSELMLITIIWIFIFHALTSCIVPPPSMSASLTPDGTVYGVLY